MTRKAYESIAVPETYEDFLDGLRGIAILMVLAYHTIFTVNSTPYFELFPVYIEHLSRGVQLFFIVSAFTLFHSAERRWKADRRPVLSFYIRRLFRIMPLWWLAVLVYWIFWNPQHPPEWVAATALMIFGFMKEAWAICLIPGGWSIFVEESFYWFFPLWYRWIKSISTALIFLAIATGVGWWWLYHTFSFALSPHFVAIFPLANYFAFFAGIALYYWKRDHFPAKLDTTIGRMFLNAGAVMGFAGLFFCDRLLGTFCLVPVVVSSFVPKTFVGVITRNFVIVRFGTYCYSIYLFHAVIGRHLYLPRDFLFHYFSWPQEAEVAIWFFPFAGISFALAMLSFRYLEKPIVNFGRNLALRL